jgi:methyltransferase
MILGLLLAEARLSSRNQAMLRARGATMPMGDIYRPMAVAYPAAFVAMGIEGVLRASTPPDAAASGVILSGAILFVASKALKYWAIRSLGDRWSFRVLVLPAEPLVASGPYQYVAHPNYIAVLGELVGTAMMMRASVAGPCALAVFSVILWLRVRFETAVLRQAYQGKHE